MSGLCSDRPLKSPARSARYYKGSEDDVRRRDLWCKCWRMVVGVVLFLRKGQWMVRTDFGDGSSGEVLLEVRFSGDRVEEVSTL